MHTSRPVRNRNPHSGRNFDEFLREEGILEDVQAAALKRALALKLADIMERKRIKKSAIAKQMRTSRAALDRLLDPANTSVTLATLTRAARAVGGKIKIELIAA
jgi:antitoxin HicB